MNLHGPDQLQLPRKEITWESAETTNFWGIGTMFLNMFKLAISSIQQYIKYIRNVKYLSIDIDFPSVTSSILSLDIHVDIELFYSLWRCNFQ